jgi:Tol biopolymer transport system component
MHFPYDVIELGRCKMKKLGFLWLIVLVLAVSVLPASQTAQKSQSADVLLGAALHQEEVEGNLEAAIKIYQKLLADFPGNRPLAAQAHFRIGMCYEKLGRREAQKAYQTVVRDYGEQKEFVAQAQERLSKLKMAGGKTEEPEGIRIRQVWKKPYTDFLGSVSPDGRFLAYVDWGEGDLAFHDLISGENKILTHEADLGLAKGFAMDPIFSKNGRQIAYSWWNPNHTYDLFLVDLDNPSPHKLYRREGEHVGPASWLSDKELIFSRFNYAARTAQFCSLRIPDGTIRELKAFDFRKWPRLSCSPDEKHIAYDFANETDGGKFDINLLAMEGDSEIPLVKHPANDRVLGWVPGRKEFLFISDRSGTWDLWAIPVDGGKPSGPEKRIYTDIGEVEPVGFAQNGDFFFGFNRQNFNASVAPFNAETGELQEKSGKTLLGSNYWLAWSPDGKYLSYAEENPKADNTRQFVVQDQKTGEERKLADGLSVLSSCWSPDGNSISVVGFEKSITQKSIGIYIVDVRTGQARQVVNLLDNKNKFNPPDDDSFPLSDVQWSADGKSIFYLFFTGGIIKRDLATGEEKILYRHPRFERGAMKLSPDGKSLLFGVQNLEEKKSRLFTIPVEGGPEKELCPPREAFGLGAAMWSSDGKYIYFSEKKGDATSLWRLPAEGGIPQKTWHSKNPVEFFGIHPDGKQMALAIREREMEIRVIENLAQELEKKPPLEKGGEGGF